MGVKKIVLCISSGWGGLRIMKKINQFILFLFCFKQRLQANISGVRQTTNDCDVINTYISKSKYKQNEINRNKQAKKNKLE